MSANSFHVIKDPVHGTMQFTSLEDAWVKPFIDSANFQRLRHIKQLGLGDLIFPGAVHTRFNHSLGCCYVAGQIAQKIGLADEERQLVMIACLLHDIGHGPFSHAFEGIFTSIPIRHEDWTPYLLADYNTKDFFSLYNQRNPRYHFSEEKFRMIADMIMHQPSIKNVLADVVSSQLDADRLDYLLRDSHFCGVRYGEFDFRWMLHCLAIVQTNEGERLGITYKGIGAVEHYLMARRLMIRNIYHSKKKLALECLLVELLSMLAADLDTHSAFKSIKQTLLGQFLFEANQFNQANTQDLGKQSKSEFLKKNYSLYKQLCDYDIFSLIQQLIALNDNHPATQIALRLHHRRMPKIIALEQRDYKNISDDLKNFKSDHPYIENWQLNLIRTPHQSYSGEDDPIWMINEQKEMQPIGKFSSMIDAISDKFEDTAFLAMDTALLDNKNVNLFLKKMGVNS